MTGTLSHQAIANYNLFGEAGDLPDVVHCETIEARSRLNEWEFAPHRHARLHQVLLIESGGGQANLEGAIHEVQPMALVNVPRGDVHAFSFTPGTQGWVVTFASEMLDETLLPGEGLALVLSRACVARGNEAVQATMDRIFAEFAGRRFARAQVLRGLAGVLLGLVARELAGPARGLAARADAGIFRRFEALLEGHYLEHWPVAGYARALSISPTHLSRIARAVTGRPASRLIEERIVREARRNLVFTNLPVATIAYALGFSDPAYFSRVFTRATGMAPRDFREQAANP